MNNIHISGTYYSSEDFRTNQMPPFFESSDTHKQLYNFLREWYSPSETIRLQTSGSTGKPKEIVVRKSQMLQSAAMTCRFFNLNKKSKALLCLSTEYIAGKMMVVRAIYCGMDLYPVETSGHPLAETSTAFDFAAMVPLQIYNSLTSTIEKERLSQIKNIIVGGGAIDSELEEAIRGFQNSIYSTYGMTETLSHIGLRKINGIEASLYYTPLSGVNLKLSDNQTLTINAPHLSDEIIMTNDIAEIQPDGSFRIFGRIDNIINTGGLKVQIEEIEQKIRPYINGIFVITSIPHPKLGETVVLLVESLNQQNIIEDIINEVNKILPRFQQPQYIYNVKEIPFTANGKPDRANAKRIAIEKAEETFN